SAATLDPFYRGLQEFGYVVGQNLAVELRNGEWKPDRFAALAAELVTLKVDIIVAWSTPTVAAKQTTATIPIVFAINEDPVRLGLVASLARPGNNLTGINFFGAELVAKRLELLRELVPAATRVAVLINPTSHAPEVTLWDAESAARVIGLQVQVLNASNGREIDAVFATFAHERPDALFVAGDSFFGTRRVQFANLAARHAMPATFAIRDYAEVGGLMSYGTNTMHAYRQAGGY